MATKETNCTQNICIFYITASLFDKITRNIYNKTVRPKIRLFSVTRQNLRLYTDFTTLTFTENLFV